MRLEFLFIVFFFCTISCSTNYNGMETCLKNVENRIGSDSILKKIKDSPIDSYTNFGLLINNVVQEEAKSDSTCINALFKFSLENSNYSVTVKNLIFFQQFQAYLKKENFNLSEARNKALEYEKRWKK